MAKKICTIVLPWGFYQYDNMLPMGIIVALIFFKLE